MSHFTPGPWKFSPFGMRSIVGADGERSVCSIGYSRNFDIEEMIKENDANARLIAAAPEQNEELVRSTAILEYFAETDTTSAGDAAQKQVHRNRALLARIDGDNA